MLMHIVRNLLPDEATVESSWCALFRSTHLEGCQWTGLEVAQVEGGGHTTPLHMISNKVGLSRELLRIGFS